MLNLQFVRAMTLYTHGRCAVASVESRPALRDQRIAEGRRCVRRLMRERMPWVETLAHTVAAAAKNAAGDRTACVDTLHALVSSAEKTDMAMHAWAARYRLGQVLGGAEGAALFASAQGALEAEGVKNPAATVAIYLPGRWGG
jgi:hypothetical protein